MTHYFISFVGLFFLFTPVGHTEDKAPTESAATTATAPESAEAEAPKLTAEGEKIWAHMKELFETSKMVNSTKADERKTARSRLEAAMDWERIAKECLGASWSKQSAKNLATYKNLLKEVMLKTAYSRMGKFWDGATYSLSKLDLKGNNAVVTARFDSKGDVITLDYFLQKKGKWQIYDISYEDLRYSININEQIDAFLKEKGFTAFLDKLKKRSAELDSEANKKS